MLIYSIIIPKRRSRLPKTLTNRRRMIQCRHYPKRGQWPAIDDPWGSEPSPQFSSPKQGPACPCLPIQFRPLGIRLRPAKSKSRGPRSWCGPAESWKASTGGRRRSPRTRTWLFGPETKWRYPHCRKRKSLEPTDTFHHRSTQFEYNQISSGDGSYISTHTHTHKYIQGRWLKIRK